MPPSIGLHDKRSEDSHDGHHQLRSHRSTSVPAKQNRSSTNISIKARLQTDLAKPLNKDLEQPISTSVRVSDFIQAIDHTALATSRLKLMHTNLDQPSKVTAWIENTGSKLPMHQARLTVIPSRRDETIRGVSFHPKFNTVTKEKYLHQVSSRAFSNSIESKMEKNKPLLPCELSNSANANQNETASKDTNLSTNCKDTACSQGTIGCGVDGRTVKMGDSTKELRCAYSKEALSNSKAYSTAGALKYTINTGKITEGSSGNTKYCEDDTSTSQFSTRSNLKTFVVHNHSPKAVQSNAESKLSILSSDFLESSYKCAVHSLEDDYLTDIVPANDVSFKKPGEQFNVSSKSDANTFLNQRMDVVKIEVLNKEMDQKSLSDVIIENTLVKDKLQTPTQPTKDEPLHTIRQDHLSSKQYTTNQPYLRLPKISQEQGSESQSVSNRREILEMKIHQNQQRGYRCNPHKPPQWKFEEVNNLVNSQRVEFPQKQVCISVSTPTKIPQSFQQSKTKESRSNQESLYDRPNSKVQHCYALPRSSQPVEGNLQYKAQNGHELRYQSTEENRENQRQNAPLLSVYDEQCQTNLTVAARSGKEPERGKISSEAKKTQQQSKSNDLPRVVGIEMKLPSAKHIAVTPVSKKSIKKISPQRLSRFERTNTKKLRATKNRSSYRRSFVSPKNCLRHVCPCARCSQNVSMLESAIMYHTGNSPHARSEDVVVASCLNQYIELIFSGLDSNNTGFITEEQFVALMRSLGCETPIPDDKTILISSVNFPKRLWQCWSQNHSQTTYLDKPKARKPLLESILSSKSDIESIENLSGQLDDINTSLNTSSSYDSIEYANLNQGLGLRLWQNKQRDLARSKENRCLKGTLRDLRSALLRLGVENVILKVKILMESSGNGYNSVMTGLILDEQDAGTDRECVVLSNGDIADHMSSNQYSIEECSKCRKHKCPDVHLSSLGTEQKRNSSYDPKQTSSKEESDTKFHKETSEWKSKITSSDENLCELYLPMNAYEKSPAQRMAHSPSNIIIREPDKQLTPETKAESTPKEGFITLSENTYVNQLQQLYAENPIYCTMNNDDQDEYMAIKTEMDLPPHLGSKMTSFQSYLDDAEREEEVRAFGSGTESPPQQMRSYRRKSSTQNSSRSKSKLSYSIRSSRPSRIRRTTVISRTMGDCPPPLLPRRRYINQPKLSHNQKPFFSPNQLSPTSFGTTSSEMDAAIPYSASTPIRSENQRFSLLTNPIDNLQKPAVGLDRPQHHYLKFQPTSRTSVSSSRLTSVTTTENPTKSDAYKEQVDVVDAHGSGNSFSGVIPSYKPQPHHEYQGTLNPEQDHTRRSNQTCEGVTEASEGSAVDVLDSDLPRGALRSRSTSLKNLLSLSTPRKTSTGWDPKTPKKTTSGKNIKRALPELLARRALLLEALSAVTGKGWSPAVEEACIATHLRQKPMDDTAAHGTGTPSLGDGMGKPSSETAGPGFFEEDSISLEDDESEETNQGHLEKNKVGVENLKSSVLENEEEFKRRMSTIDSSLVLVSGRRRSHNPRGSSRRRERNVRLPVITENVEVKPNVRLSLKLYENLRLDNLNISEDASDEATSENNDLTVDDILAEVMTYCRENSVPIKENRFNECVFKGESDECYVNPTNFESIHTSESDGEHSVNLKPCIIYNENSPSGAPHNTLTEDWKRQHYHKLPQSSPQLVLSSNATDITSNTNTECTNSCVCCDHTLEDKPCSGGVFETELEGCAQAEEEVEEQEDDGSVLLEDACNSSCSSGSDSGRGESETSCPTPEEHLSCNSGGSDDGMWTSEDYSCLNHMISGSHCHPQPNSYQAELSSCDKTQATSPQAEESQTQNITANLNSITPNLDTNEHSPTHFECGQVDGKGFGNEKTYSIGAKTILEESQNDNHQEASQNPGPLKFIDFDDCAFTSVPKRSEMLATLFIDYDNVDNCLNNDTPLVEQEPKLKIIDLDEEQSSTQQSIREHERMKSKSFFRRRSNSFNTFRSFISSTTSHLKRNGPCRSSFSSSKSLPNYFSSTTAVPDLTPYSETQLKSIFKSNANRTGSNLKRNSSKRISFSDTINVYPEGSTFPVNAEGKRCYRYPAGLEIPESSPRTSSQVSTEIVRDDGAFELQRDVGIGDQVESKNAEHRNEFFHVNQNNEISSYESVILTSRNSLDLNDILMSLTEFNDEIKKKKIIDADPVINDVNFHEKSKPVSEVKETQELESIHQASLYDFGRHPEITKDSSKSKMNFFSYPCHNPPNDYTEVKQNVGFTLTPAAPRLIETPSEGSGSGQALLAALELELEGVLRSLEDEETELE